MVCTQRSSYKSGEIMYVVLMVWVSSHMLIHNMAPYKPNVRVAIHPTIMMPRPGTRKPPPSAKTKTSHVPHARQQRKWHPLLQMTTEPDKSPRSNPLNLHKTHLPSKEPTPFNPKQNHLLWRNRTLLLPRVKTLTKNQANRTKPHKRIPDSITSPTPSNIQWNRTQEREQ